MEKRDIKKILFYPGFLRTLRSTMIGHLYEIAQVYPVVLLLDEEIDEETKAVLQDKKLFPKLEKIILIPRYVDSKSNIFKKNRDLCRLFKKIVYLYKPDIVIASNDFFSSRLYLMRFAKRINAVTFSIQASPELDSASIRKNVDLINAHLRFPGFFPKCLCSFLVQCRKYVGHFLYHWILPIFAGQLPLLGKSSYILRKGKSGMRDADYQIVFSEREYNIHVKEGVPAEKIYILKHPMERHSTREFFEKVLLNSEKYKTNEKTVVLLIPSEEISFRRKDDSLISKKERQEERIKIVKLVAETLKDWKIFIKPHPNFKDYEKAKEVFESVSDSVEFVNPQEPSDKYMKMSEIIVGLPKSVSAVLFTSSLLFHEKAILSLDLSEELSGDFYKDFDGIEYIDSEEKLVEILILIRDSKYCKETGKKAEKEEDFKNTVELLNYLFNKKTAAAKK